MLRNISLLLCLGLAFVTVGCGNKVRLHGTVTFSDDGTPLPMGTVCFENENFVARGIIGENGDFVVGSNAKRDGIPPGIYRVIVTGAFRDIGLDKHDMPISEPLIDRKYASASTSDLAVTVDRSTRRYDIQVDRYKDQANH